MNKLVNKCIENAIDRINNPHHKMNAYSYITYYSKRNDFTFEEVDYIRSQISKYIDENSIRIFNINFTINGLSIKEYEKLEA